jgi:hypothetical protein
MATPNLEDISRSCTMSFVLRSLEFFPAKINPAKAYQNKPERNQKCKVLSAQLTYPIEDNSEGKGHHTIP